MRIKAIFFGLFILLQSSLLWSQSVKSVYTNVEKSCRKLKKDEIKGLTYEEGMIYQECPGLGGYKIILADHSLLTIISPTGKEKLLSVGIGKCLPYIAGEKIKIEWRMRQIQKGLFVPYAMIVRMAADQCRNGISQTISYLVVVKMSELTEPCIIANVSPSPKQNELAREIADNATIQRCITETEPINYDMWCHNEGEPCGD